ncbi:hypothetical protein [Cupriavidus sp. WS]|uniref:hypothetical protein n=1 Tax=Cupriavidus sp. WS TaxID=1312922 RepID=UPI0012DE38C2|nr:hypothetical protein [Cupriavidus sp. WS]
MQNHGEPRLRVEERAAIITLSRPQMTSRLSPRDLEVLREHINAVDGMEQAPNRIARSATAWRGKRPPTFAGG